MIVKGKVNQTGMRVRGKEIASESKMDGVTQ